MEIFIETERLFLREILPSDKEGMFEMDSDPAVHKFLGNRPLKTIDEAKQLIASIRSQYVQNGIGRWAVIEKETESFIGWCGLKLITEKINNHTQYYDMGYRLVKRYWGKGFASESAKATLKYGFKKLQLKTIYGIADVKNSSSRKVLEKTGFQCMGTFDYMGVPHYWFEVNNESAAKP